MTDTQKELLKLLCEFDEICRDNHIEYILAGGGALGAVRNGGFLPWDDDIDILIKRSEYEKLDKVLSASVPEGRAWITDENTPGYNNPVSRYYDLSTTLLYRTLTMPGVPKAHHLEIFIMDPYPDDPEKQLHFRQMLWLYTELRNPLIMMASQNLPLEVTKRELYDEYKARIEKEGMDAVIAEIRSEICGYREEDCHLWCGRWSRMAYVFEDDWVGKTQLVDFEGHQFPIGKGVFHHMMENYDSHWNIVPREGDRRIHRSIDTTEVSYLEHEEEMERICREDGYINKLETSKQLYMQWFFDRQDLHTSMCELRLMMLQAEVEQLEKKTWKFDYARIDELEQDFLNFMAIMIQRSFQKFHQGVPLRSDLLETMLLTLVFRDRYESACFFLDLYPDWEKYDYYKQALHELGEMKLARYYEDTEKVTEYLQALKKYPEMDGQYEIDRTLMWLKTTEEPPLDRQQILQLVATLKNPNDPDVRKYTGDLYMKAGYEKQAMELYAKMFRRTRNGIILHEFEERGLIPKLEAMSRKSVFRRGVRWLKRNLGRKA